MNGEKIAFAVSGGLLLTPPTVMLLQEISLMAAVVAGICGAIIGVAAVWRLCRHRK